MGCASGKNAGPRNIFGNKYGQNLAAVQIAREKRLEVKRLKEAEQVANARLRELQQQQQQQAEQSTDDDDDAETDDDADDDDDDYGPTPVAGIWASSSKLEQESETLAAPYIDDNDAGDAETDDEEERPTKKVRADE